MTRKKIYNLKKKHKPPQLITRKVSWMREGVFLVKRNSDWVVAESSAQINELSLYMPGGFVKMKMKTMCRNKSGESYLIDLIQIK